MVSYFFIKKKKHLQGAPFSERPTRAKSLSLRSPATCYKTFVRFFWFFLHIKVHGQCAIITGNTYRERLSSFLDDKTLYEMGENLRLDHCLRNRCSVFVSVHDSWQGQRQGQGGRRREGRSYKRSWWRMKETGTDWITTVFPDSRLVAMLSSIWRLRQIYLSPFPGPGITEEQNLS